MAFDKIKPTMHVCIIVPVLNAMSTWPAFSRALSANLSDLNLQPSCVLAVDSDSNDGTAEAVRESGFRLLSIRRKEFDHGATRQFAADNTPDADLLVYLTQDAILVRPDSLRELVNVFANPDIGAAYGRQLPRIGASPIEAHARLFNYPPKSRVRNLVSREELGIKSIFFSNSFGGYRRSALQQIGGFPSRTIFGEDTVIAARLHLHGWQTAYVSSAEVYHSHSYSYKREFQRFFDIGVLHAREPWILREFGRAGNEGIKFLISETRFLWPSFAYSFPSAWIRTLLKYCGYHLGRHEASLNIHFKKWMSMNRLFWENETKTQPETPHR